MTIPDPISDIVAVLAANAAVTALVSDRVYGGGLPPDQNALMPRAAVLVKPAGGPGRGGFEGWRYGRVDTVCFAASLGDSWRLHLAVREALEEMGRTASVFTVEMISDGTNALDPVKQWPTCYASYLVASAVTA